MPINQDIERAWEPLIKHRDREVHSNKVEGKGHSNKKDGSVCVLLFSTLVAVCGSFEFGSCVGYSGPTQSGIRKDLGLSLSEYSVFGSIVNIGAMIGAITSGRIADFMGRKGAMRLAAAFCILGWTAVYLSQGALLLDLGRFCMGYGTGILSYVVPVFIAEIAPKNLRGGLTTLNQLMICSGASFAFIVGTMVTWRTLALTGIVPCIVLLAGLFLIPESPRWLAKAGRQKDFMAALQYLRGESADISNEAAEIQDFVDALADLPQANPLDLFQKQYARSVVVGVGLMVFQQFGGINGLAFYVSETFVSAGFNSGSLGTILWACIQIPITAFGAVLMDKTGRTALLKISATGTGIGCILAGLSFCLKGYAPLHGWGPILALTGILMYIGSFSMGMGAVPWVVMSEIFPMNIKGIAGSLVTLVNWAGAWAVSYTFNFLMTWSSSGDSKQEKLYWKTLNVKSKLKISTTAGKKAQPQLLRTRYNNALLMRKSTEPPLTIFFDAGTFFLYAGVSVATVLFVVKVVPETKGRTLEEIQSSMNS